MSSEILIVDDEADIRDLVSGILGDEGYNTRTAGDGDSALREVGLRCPNLVLLDVWLQGSKLDGLDLLDVLKERHPELPVVMISGHGNVETAVSAMKRGAYDFIEKPFKTERLLLMTARALESSRLHREVTELRARSSRSAEIIGSSAAVSRLRNTIDKVAKTGARVLITGAPGSGKELAARRLHEASPRRKGPFVVLNSAILDPERVEYELFGTEPDPGGRGHVGVLESAHSGTLYIDEIADISLGTQAKILHVLMDQKFCRMRGHTPVEVDVRIVCSTSRDLESEARAGHFRSDLFHRLSVESVHVPSLSERRDDIPELVAYFIQQISCAESLPPLDVSDEIIALFQSHDWAGNVRQLRNAVERLMILSSESPERVSTQEECRDEILDALPASPITLGVNQQLMAMPLRRAREVFEREYLVAQITRFGGNISKTSEFVKIERSALHRKLRLLGIANVANQKLDSG